MAQKRLLTRGSGDPAVLLLLLRARLGLSEEAARERLLRGAVFVEGQRCQQETTRVPVGARLRVFMEEEPAAPRPAQGERSPLAPTVLFEDQDLLVIGKPAGLLSQPSPSGGASLLSFFAARGETPLLCHRLDRDASGLLVLARHPEAQAAIQHSMNLGVLGRGYLAVVAGEVAPVETVDGNRDGLIDLRIARDPHDARLRQALPPQAPGGQEARTHYRVLAPLPEATATLLALALLTGRTHQIRVHLRALGHPLLGDRDYGGPPAPRLLLHAAWLTFPHPRTGARMRFVQPCPFPRALLARRAGARSDLLVLPHALVTHEGHVKFLDPQVRKAQNVSPRTLFYHVELMV